jgi:two-component system NtrC family sensor kinase
MIGTTQESDVARLQSLSAGSREAKQDLESLRFAIDQYCLVSVADGEGRIIEMNAQFSRACGYSAEELNGQDHRRLKSSEHSGEFFASLWQTVGAGKVWRGDICNRRKDGGVFWVSATIVPFLDQTGKPYRYISIQTDITAVKAIEGGLRNSNDLFRTLTETIDSAVFMHRGSKLTYANPAALRLTGFTREELLEMEHWEVAHPDSREMLRARGAARMRGEIVPSHYELRIMTKSGEERWADVTAAFFQFEGAPAVLRTYVDITQRKVAEQALRSYQAQLERLVEERTAELGDANRRLEEDVSRRERAEVELQRRNAELTEVNQRLSMAQEQLLQSEKMASIGQLAAGVAHEINNPIGYVNSNLSSLEGYCKQVFEMLDVYEVAEPSISDAKLSARIAAVKEETDLRFVREDIAAVMVESREGITRVKKIVQDLKDFSRVDARQEWQLVNLHEGIDSTLNIVSNEIKYKADVVREYGELPEIECLSSQLNQVVMNLLVNAAHAIGEKRGRITIRTGCEGEEAWFEVADNGAGIPAEVQSRIFDPFFTTKPIGKGTGLGLSLSYGIVQKHHGRFEVHSEPGHGATFRVWLPIRHTAKASANHDATAEPGVSRDSVSLALAAD